jgi:hypothetical protein
VEHSDTPIWQTAQRIKACRKGGGVSKDARGIGDVVFGGQEVDKWEILAVKGPFVGTPGQSVNMERPVTLIISGCVTYQNEGEMVDRCTGIWGMISHTKEDGLMLKPDRTYPAADMRLFQGAVGQFIDDCERTE